MCVGSEIRLEMYIGRIEKINEKQFGGLALKLWEAIEKM